MNQDLFTKLVSISSPSGDEKDIAHFVREKLSSLGLETIIDKEGNVLARTNGKGVPRLISAHLDTVQGNTKVKPVKKGQFIKSSGDSILGADNKAALAGIMHALSVTPDVKKRNLEIIFSVREETDGGVSKMDLGWLRSKEGISADSGEPIGTIVSDTPYIVGFEIDVYGKSSHSSEPENGINALSIASHAISSFKWGKVDEDTTANIGLIAGGSAVNTTPGKISLIGEIRSYNRESLQATRQELVSKFESAAGMYKGKVNFKFDQYCEGYSFLAKEVSFRRIKNVYRKLKIKEKLMKSFGGSDANFFNSKGIRVVDVGDGVSNPHTFEECVKVSDLRKLSNIFSVYITG